MTGLRRATCGGVMPLVLLLMVGCKGTTSPTASTPVVQRVTETFSGALTQGAAVVHPFTVSTAGQVDVVLTSVAPLATLAIGVAIGTWDGTTCTVVVVNDNARAGTASVIAGTAQAGNFCIRVYDSGNIMPGVTVEYALNVIHP